MMELKPCPFCGRTNIFVGTIAECEMQDQDHPDYQNNSAIYTVACDYKDTGWCYHHSHFVTPESEACHPWESANWKMLDENDFCSYGERRADDG